MSEPVKIIDIWINCPDETSADTMAERLVRDRLVACSNIFPAITSRYHWKGKVESATEVPLLLKTREDLFDNVCRVVRELHPYETPGIQVVAVEKVNDDYRQWVINETST